MIPITRPELPELSRYTELLGEIWSSRMLSNFGVFAERLEHGASEYLGVPVTAVVSGDIGLVLAIRALALPPKSRALVPSFTFNSTVNAILWNGLTPHFVDTDPATLTIDPRSVETAIASGPVSLIVATHTFGNPADTGALEDLARTSGSKLVFDAAHAYGSRRDSVAIGNFGDCEVFSLSGTKLVTSAEGGMIAAADSATRQALKLLRGYGFYGDYNSRLVGLNGKMSELHAALGTLTLPRVEEAIANRFRLVQEYMSRLSEGNAISFQHVRPEDRSTFKDFALRFASVDARANVEAALARVRVQTKRYFRPCHSMPAFSAFGGVDLPGTREAAGRVLCVPLFEALSLADVEKICVVIHSALRE